MGQARDEAGNIWETDANGNPVRLIHPAGQGGVFTLPPDPVEQARLANEQERIRIARELANAQLKRGSQPPLPVGYRMGPNGVAERIPGLPPTDTAGAPKITAKVREDAIAAYNNAASLERIAADLEKKFQAGPGKTSGLAGLMDYLPTGENKAFNDTAYQARGYVKQGLGFTGGEGNTIGEIALNYGPYLPEAGDRDAQIVNKIAALRSLAADSRKKAVATLGGVPDANGQVRPIEQVQSQPVAAQQDPNARINFQNNRGAPPRPPRPGERANYDPASDSWNFSPINPDPALNDPLEVDVQGGRLNPEDQARLDRMIAGSDAVGSGVVGFTDALTFGLSDEAGGALDALMGTGASGGSFGDRYNRNVDVNRRFQDALQQRDPGSSLSGSVLGSTVGMVGVNSLLRNSGRLAPLATRGGGLGGDALYGAAYGTGASDDNRALGALTGAASAGAGNFVGNKFVGGVGRIATGVSNPAVRYLADRGIPMTPGQVFGQSGILGKGFKHVEDAFGSIPFLGQAISQRRNEGLEAFNREAFKDALAPINQQVEGVVGQDAIDSAQDMVSNAYGDAIGNVQLRADGPFIRQADPILERGSNIPVTGEQFKYLVDNKIYPLFDGLKMDGRGFQSSLQTLNKAVPEFNKQGIMGNEAAGAAREFKDSLIDLANRQAPQVTPALNAANTANRNVSILEDAVLGGVNSDVGSGIFTPAQLARFSVNNTKKYGGKKAAAAGGVPFRKLTEAGQAVLPSKLPNSGTADRAWATMLLPGVLGGSAAGANALDLSPETQAILGLAAAASTKRGGKFIQSAATRRPDDLINVGEEILRRRRLGGMFGAGAAIPLVQ